MESPFIVSQEEKLFSFLQSLNIETRTYRHPPVFTVEDSKEHCRHIEGAHTKNLFIRDKKKQYALAVVMDTLKVDLRRLAETAGIGRVSFAQPERLKEMLGVVPGSVTPFALINAQMTEGSRPPLTVVLDKAMMQHSILNYHPLHNSATTSITPAGLLAFIKACGYDPIIADLE